MTPPSKQGSRLARARLLFVDEHNWKQMARIQLEAGRLLDWACMYEVDAFGVAASLALDGLASRPLKRGRK